jgi:2-polyprenyl-6-methoxyphenol hydroxylase-like FAD-dependent oxidoreductase
LGGLETPFKDAFDAKKMRDDRMLHWLMRSSLLAEEKVVEMAERGYVHLGDAAHTHPILDGEGANEAILDGIELGEWIARYGTENMGRFLEGRYEEWNKGVEDSERKLREVHGM